MIRRTASDSGYSNSICDYNYQRVTCFCFLFNRTVILGNMTAIQLYMLHMQEISGFGAPVVLAVLDGILHSTVTSAVDL